MAEPDLAAAFQKPKVMQAIMESQQNPMAIMKYQDDPDVMMARHLSPSSPPHLSTLFTILVSAGHCREPARFHGHCEGPGWPRT